MVKKYAADPNAPKRALSAYFLFANDVRSTVVDNLDGPFSVGAVGKKIGQLWAALADNKKAPYQKRSAAAKAKYAKARAAYEKTAGFATWKAGQEEHKKAQKAQAKRNQLKSLIPNKPKKGPSAYIRFSSANRSKYSGSLAEIAQALGKAWATASPATKAKFQKQTDADRARYEKAMAQYVQTEEYKSYEAAFKEHKTEQYKIKTYGSVNAANKAERARLAARASKQKEAEKKKRAALKARKAAIKA